MTITLEIPPDLEEQLSREAEERGLEMGDYTLLVLKTALSEPRRRQSAISLLQSWIEEDAIHGSEINDEFLKDLDQDRSSKRKLFPSNLKGTTW